MDPGPPRSSQVLPGYIRLLSPLGGPYEDIMRSHHLSLVVLP